jgi:hypothetical protein
MLEDWQVKIMENPRSPDRLMLIYRPAVDGGGHEVLHFIDGKQNIFYVKRGALIDERLYLEIPGQVLEAMQLALSGLGIQTEKESTIRGKYEAQGEHIADLQHFLGWFMNGQKIPKPVFVPLGSTVTGVGIMRGPLKKAEKRDL